MWLLIPILLYSIVYLYVRHVYTHWQRKGFPSERTSLTWPFLQQVYQREFRHVTAICEAYRAGRSQLWGIYCFFRPILLVRDVTLAHVILEQSNGHFNNNKWDYVKGYRRFNLLEKLAPIFSRNYLTDMFRNVGKCGDHMVSHLEDMLAKSVTNTVEVDMQQVLRIYSVNIVGNLVYGQDANNFERNDDILTKYVTNAVQTNGFQSFTLSRLPTKSSLTYRLRDLIKSCIEEREDGGHVRRDILQLLIKFRNGNDLETCNVPKINWHIENSYDQDKQLSIQRLSVVAEDLLKMSLDSIASMATLTLYELLKAPTLLERLRGEIKKLECSSESPKPLDLTQLDSMEYLDMCIQETLRKYPPIPIIERVCRKSYKLPNSRFTIVEGKTVMVPLLAIQRDEKYFAEPLKYKPTRFQNKPKEGIKDAFLGYGLGGTQCVAQNFSKMVIKLALIKLFHNFELELLAKEDLEILHQPAPFINAKEGLQIRIKNPKIKAKFYL